MTPKAALKSLNPRERLVVAVGAALVLVVWGGTRHLPRAIEGLAHYHAATQDLGASVVRAEGLLAAEPALRESLGVRARTLVSLAESLFAGGTPSEAAAEFSSFVSGAAGIRFVRIARMDAAADSGEGLFRRVTVRVEAEGDIAGVTAWIADLEGSPQAVRVGELWISAPEPGAPATQTERLRVEVRLSALALVRARAEASD